MKKSELRVGMRVRVTGVEDRNEESLGKIGVIVAGWRNKAVAPYDCAVKFPKTNSYLWSCGDLCPIGRGFLFGAENLTKVPALKKKG
jgi:hypothetical protein